MKVSIIVTSYNRPDTLGWSLRSALTQTHPDTEVVVVDAGNNEQASHIGRTSASKQFFQKEPGGELEIYKPAGDAISKLVYLQMPNTGVADARNLATKISKGNAIIFLDDDNWLEPTFVEKTAALMSGNVGVVSTDMHVFSESSDSVVAAEIATVATLRDRNTIHSSSLLLRKAFEQAGGNKNDVYEDWELWLAVLKLGWAMRVVNEPLLHYRKAPESLITRHAQRHEERIENMKALHPEIYD